MFQLPHQNHALYNSMNELTLLKKVKMVDCYILPQFKRTVFFKMLDGPVPCVFR